MRPPSWIYRSESCVWLSERFRWNRWLETQKFGLSSWKGTQEVVIFGFVAQLWNGLLRYCNLKNLRGNCHITNELQRHEKKKKTLKITHHFKVVSLSLMFGFVSYLPKITFDWNHFGARPPSAFRRVNKTGITETLKKICKRDAT